MQRLAHAYAQCGLVSGGVFVLLVHTCLVCLLVVFDVPPFLSGLFFWVSESFFLMCILMSTMSLPIWPCREPWNAVVWDSCCCRWLQVGCHAGHARTGQTPKCPHSRRKQRAALALCRVLAKSPTLIQTASLAVIRGARVEGRLLPLATKTR